jgi:hypothetical protein
MSEQEQRLRTEDLASTRPERDEAQRADAPTQTNGSSTESQAPSDESPLLAADEAEDYRWRWDAIQTRFVDAPRDAVADADALVAELMRHLAEVFSRERADLEASWESGQDVSTEDLRVSMQRYRSFFNRLLAT